MKPSHYTTPRSTSECTWDNHSDPIERPPKAKRQINYWRLMAIALATLLAALFLTDTSEPMPPEIAARIIT